MLFNSYIFVLLFLPACLLGYFALNYLKRYTISLLFVLGMSLWFYGYFNPSYLVIIIVSIAFNYLVNMTMSTLRNIIAKKLVLVAALAVNISVLFYFKYYDFFVDNVNQLFKTDFALRHVVLPLGISFFTFQQISYVIDSYKGEVPKYNLIQYASFVVFFPQLIAGPIVTHGELIPQFMDEKKKKINWENVSSGGYIFALGMAKKVLIADVFGNAANWGFGNVALLDTTNAVLTILAYTIQIYFDFSGYCDMAIGIARMMNIDLPVNFNSPYKSLSIAEFWDRWHITLTRFFTKYVYIPLGGSRKGELRTCVNIMIVFLLSGIWHGANWTFVLWGCLHGLFSVIYRLFKSQFDKLHPVFNWLLTFGFLYCTWGLFRANSIQEAGLLLGRVIALKFGPIADGIASAFSLIEFTSLPFLQPLLERYPYMIMLSYFSTATCIVLGSKNAYERMQEFKPSLFKAVYCAFLLMWAVISFSGVSTFLYFNF